MKITFTIILALIVSVGIAQNISASLPVYSATEGLLVDSTQSVYFERKTDTVTVITYCINTKTLVPKWFKLKSLNGLEYPSVYINGLIIYNKWLDVPKGYKAVYSIE